MYCRPTIIIIQIQNQNYAKTAYCNFDGQIQQYTHHNLYTIYSAVQKVTHYRTPYNFIKYLTIIKLISQSESEENL